MVAATDQAKVRGWLHAFRASRDEGEWLRKVAAERGVSMSDLVREGLRSIDALPRSAQEVEVT